MNKTEIKTVSYNVSIYEKLCDFICMYSWFVRLLIELMICHGTIKVEFDAERNIKSFIFTCKECNWNIHVRRKSILDKSVKIIKHLKIDKMRKPPRELNLSSITCMYDLDGYMCDVAEKFCEFTSVDDKHNHEIGENISRIKHYKLNYHDEHIMIEKLMEEYPTSASCVNCGLYIKSYNACYDDLLYDSHAINHIITARNKKNIKCTGVV